MTTPSDAYLQKWWREAVRFMWGNRCAFADTGECCGDLECHHVRKRGRILTRHYYKNGILVCQFHHRYAETPEGRAEIESMVDTDMLEERNASDAKQWLQDHGMSKAEFLNNELEELKEIAAGVRPPSLLRADTASHH